MLHYLQTTTWKHFQLMWHQLHQYLLKNPAPEFSILYIYIYMVSPPRSRSSTKEGCHGILPGSQQLRCLREHFKTGGLRIQRRFSLVSFRCCHLFFIARTCRLTNGTLDNLHRRYVCQHEKICQRISAGKPTTEPCSWSPYIKRHPLQRQPESAWWEWNFYSNVHIFTWHVSFVKLLKAP